jgi:hypothetical protein
MAERRMFAKTIIDSDAFLDMPVTARLLYYDLAMRADDDGFVNSPKKIMKFVGATTDDLGILAMRKFIIPFENGVVVIKHWRIHNYIRKDTYKETPYKDEKALLELDENNAYRYVEESRGRAVDEPWTQVRLGKDRIGKDRVGEESVEEIITAPIPTTYGDHNLVNLSDAEYQGLLNTYGKDITEDYIQRIDEYMYYNDKQYPSHYKTIIRWIEKDKKDGAYHKPKKSTFNNLEQRQDTDYDRQAYDLAKAQREAWKKKKGEQA